MEFQLPIAVEIIVSALLLLGSFFIMLAALALVRLPDFFVRLHGPPMATTMGMGASLVGSALYFTFSKGSLHIQDLLIIVFVFLSGPVTGYILAKAAVLHQLPLSRNVRGRPWDQ